MLERNKLNTKNNFSKNAIWNYFVFFVIGVLGILGNVLIARFLGSENVGLISVYYALFIVGGQLGAFGIGAATFHYIVTAPSELIRKEIISSSIIVAFFTATIFILIISIISENYQFNIFDNYPQISCLYIAIIICSINKSIINTLNAENKLIDFSKIQLIRQVGIFLCIVLSIWQSNKNILVYSFGVGEGASLLLALKFLSLNNLSLRINNFSYKQAKNLLIFGSKSVLYGFSVELNTRIDTLILALYVSKHEIGVYGFVAVFAEGYYQLLVVVKNLIASITAKKIVSGQKRYLIKLFKKTRNYIFPAMAIIGIGVYVGVFLILKYYFNSSNIGDSMNILTILLISILIASPVMPFESIFNLSGQPRVQSLIAILALIFNTAIAFMLVGDYGIFGVALSTGLTYILTSTLIIIFIKNCFGINFLNLRY